jgi:hypothetical protein
VQIPTASADVDLGLHVARVAANEGALVNRRETALIWQVARVNGLKRGFNGIDDFLRRHSGRVYGLKPCFGGNCMWSPQLTRSDVQPLGLNLRADIWALRVAPIWLDVLRYADYLVAGLGTPRERADDPCHLPPRTWGGPMDKAGAIARGIYPIGCVGTCSWPSCNDGYTFYKDCWKDGFWACDPTAEPAVQSLEPANALMTLAQAL